MKILKNKRRLMFKILQKEIQVKFGDEKLTSQKVSSKV
jgi:hypothetical protein